MTAPAHVFGYGSLSAQHGARPAWLLDHRRVWGVAMDNAVTIPGYKLYRDEDGSRPDVCVAFLDLEPGGAGVNGVLLDADPDRLAELDARERNYERVDVTGAIAEPPPAGRVWAYMGRAEARERLRSARATGRAVVQERYASDVEAGFAALGADQLAAYRAGTVAHGLPLRSLTRVPVVHRAG